MTIFKTKKTRFFIRCWWSWYIYWIPTIQTSYHPKDESVLCNFSVSNEDESYKGSEFELNLLIFIWNINLTYWWKIEIKTYTK